MNNPYRFRRAHKDDGRMVGRWFRAPHVLEFWGAAEKNIRDFQGALAREDSLYNYWIGSCGAVPFCLLMTTDGARETPDHLAPLLPEDGDAWTLDVLIGPLDHVGRGHAAPMLAAFLGHAEQGNPALKTMLIDPEADNPRAVHVYEKAGFRKISEFTPNEGPFQGQPHILMAYHFYP